MIGRRLISKEDVDTGMIGLKFVEPHKICTGKFTISGGITLAHDILEHQQGTAKIGSIGDEMIALGGLCYVRGQFGVLFDYKDKIYGSNHSVEDNIASDITYMADIFFNDGVPFRQKLVRSKKDDETGCVDGIIETARSKWAQQTSVDATDEERDTYLESCRQLMLQGTRLAQKRFKFSDKAHDMFWRLKRATNNIIENLEFEGQEFILAYDFSGYVSFREVEQKY